MHPRPSTHSGGDCLRPSSSKGRDPWGNPPWSTGRTRARSTGKRDQTSRARTGRGVSRNGATTESTVLRHDESPCPTNMSTCLHHLAWWRRCITHHRDQVWTLEWRLSASAHGHRRHLVHILSETWLCVPFHFFAFFFSLCTRRVFQD